MSNILNIFFLISTNIILFSLCSESEILYSHTSSDQNLYFVFSTFRHGARSTFSKGDYFGNYVPNPGALSAYGAIQHLEIGKKYRQRYSNFLNMSFDKNQMYIRSSDVHRTIISTLKELEGLFGKVIDQSYLDIIKGGLNYWNLFQLNNSEHEEIDKYFNYCNRKRRLPNYNEILKNEIFPILKNCYGAQHIPNVGGFCDSVFTAYFEYTYNNDTQNKIGKCGKDNAEKMHQYCFDYFNTFRGWDEKAAYMFNFLFKNIFEHMNNFIEGRSDLRMIMIGGHDITVDKVMDFLDGLKIIPRTHFPHYACNIVMELRKYSDDFYIEFYYNDILKYNQTFKTFEDTLQNSKYSNLYNYCGSPPWIEETITETEEIKAEITQKIQNTENIEDKKEKEIIPQTQKVEEKQNEPTTPTQKIEDKPKEPIIPTQKVEEKPKEPILPTQKVEDSQKEQITPTQKVEDKPIEPILPTQKVEDKPIVATTMVSTSPTQKVEEKPKEPATPTQKVEEKPTTPTQKVEEPIKPTQKVEEPIKPTQKVEPAPITQKIEENPKEPTTPTPTQRVEDTKKIEETDSEKIEKVDENELSPLNNTNNLNEIYLSNNTSSNFEKLKTKLKKIFKQETDLNLYIILISIVGSIIIVIVFIILFVCISKRRKKFIRLTEEQSKNKSNNNNNNLSVISVENRKDEKK